MHICTDEYALTLRAATASVHTVMTVRQRQCDHYLRLAILHMLYKGTESDVAVAVQKNELHLDIYNTNLDDDVQCLFVRQTVTRISNSDVLTPTSLGIFDHHALP